MIVLFEKFSLLHFIILLPVISKSDYVYILEPHPHNKKWDVDLVKISKVIHRFLSGLSVKVLRHEHFPKVCFTSNSGSVEFIENQSDKIASSLIVRVLKGLYKDDRISLAIKKDLMHSYWNTFYMADMAEELALSRNCLVQVVPLRRDWLGLFDGRESVSIHITTKITNLIIDQFKSIYPILRYLGYLIVGQGGLKGLLRSLDSNNSQKNNSTSYPQKIKYAVQVQWKFHKGKERLIEKRTRWDNSFLENGEDFSGNNLLYVYYRDDRRMMDDLNYHQKRGSLCCDEKQLPPTGQYFVRSMIIPASFFLGLFLCGWLVCNVPSDLARAASSLLFYIHLYDRFTCYYQPKVYLGFDDQKISSIARMIVFKKYGIASVGIPHSSFGGPLIMPGIVHLSFDRLFTTAKVWQQMFYPYWNNVFLDPVGSLRSDFVHQSLLDEDKRRRFMDKYGHNSYKILASCAGTGGQNIEHRYVEHYKALQKIVDARDDVKVIIRPRNKQIPKPHHKKYIRDGLASGKITIEMDDFDTWELIAYCDLVIASATSAMINECLDSGKKFFTYLFNGIDELHPFYESYPRFIATSGTELIHRINYFLNNDDDNEYKKIQLVYGHKTDGKAIERVRRSMRAVAMKKV